MLWPKHLEELLELICPTFLDESSFIHEFK